MFGKEPEMYRTNAKGKRVAIPIKEIKLPEPELQGLIPRSCSYVISSNNILQHLQKNLHFENYYGRTDRVCIEYFCKILKIILFTFIFETFAWVKNNIERIKTCNIYVSFYEIYIQGQLRDLLDEGSLLVNREFSQGVQLIRKGMFQKYKNPKTRNEAVP